MFLRIMEAELHAMAADYPVVTVTGPRQSGKTTLVRHAFPNKPYINLEAIRTRRLVQADPAGFLDGYPEGAIIDEIQHYPELLSEIQVRADEHDIRGLFILTGSHQVKLRGAIAQSLAGRTAILHLLPLSMTEMQHENIAFDVDEILLRGNFPRIYKNHLDPRKAYSNYVQTYLERDLRQMIEVKDLQLFQKFIQLCAGRIGQIFSADNLANEVGVSAKTIAHWLSILEASYLIFLLPPYFENFGKRVIKSPKLYFCDVGLAAHLLGIETTVQMQRDPLRGNLFENLVILELIKARWNQGLEHRLSFYRDSNQNEVDVLFQAGHQLVPIEIKSASTFNLSLCRGLERFMALAPDRATQPCLIYTGKQEQKIKNIRLLHYSHVAQALLVE